MKIDGPGSIRPGTIRRNERARDGEGASFARHLSGDSASSAATIAGGAPVVSLAALLAAQGTDDAIDGRARQAGIRRGEDLLERLDEVRVGLLTGRLPKATLERLVTQLAQRRSTGGDPRLGQLLDEIELRARVELAKLAYA
ncbi:MAG: flagellar assembly protein FliX [Alphaproteobacteria bacterium]